VSTATIDKENLMLKKRIIVIIGSVLVLTAISIFISSLFLPLHDNELTENSLQVASKLYNQKISSYKVCDSKSNNDSVSFIYQFKLENGEQKYYAISYCKHFLFSKFRFNSYGDCSAPGPHIFIVSGFPYEIAYDISGYSLVVKDFILNNTLVSILKLSGVAIVIFLILFGIRLDKKKKQQMSK
jgi:predicted permease